MTGNDQRQRVVGHDVADRPGRFGGTGQRRKFCIREGLAIRNRPAQLPHPALEGGGAGQFDRDFIEAAVLALSEGLRKKVLDAMFGSEEEFEYTATTTPDASSSSSSSRFTTAWLASWAFCAAAPDLALAAD